MNREIRDEKKIRKSMSAAKKFLRTSTRTELIENIGKTIKTIPKPVLTTKRWFQKSYIIGPEQDDFLAGRDVFYITEGRKLFLDATAGHYQMTWGYDHPVLMKIFRMH